MNVISARPDWAGIVSFAGNDLVSIAVNLHLFCGDLFYQGVTRKGLFSGLIMLD